MTATLIYFVDPMCSWCWGFSPEITKVLQHYGSELNVKIVVGGLRAGETRPIPAQLRSDILHHWQQVAQTTGQPFKFDHAMPEGFIYNTEPACRAVVTAQHLTQSQALPLLHHLQQSFYQDGLDPKQPATIAAAAQHCGFKPQAFLAEWEGAAMHALTQAHFAEKEEQYITGFPSLLLEQQGQRRMISVGWQTAAQVITSIEARRINAPQL